MADVKAFFEKMLPYAQQVKDQLGQPVAVTLAQWGLESGYGTSELFKKNNVGGIKYSKYAVAGTTQGNTPMKYANYPNFDTYVKDYVRVMNLSYYDKVRASYKTNDLSKIVKALDDSPYAEDTNYYSKVYGIITQNNLQKYDSMVSVGSLYSSTNPQLNGMKITDLEKYALLGLSVLGLGLIFSSK